jgi:hypothetical protein
VSEPRIEEIGGRRDTYLFFEFGDDVSGKIVLCLVVVFVLFFVEAEGEWVGCFVISVEGVNDVLAPDGVTFSMIVESIDAGDFIPGFLGNRIVEDDVPVL